MTTTRRSTLAAIGGIGALAAAGPVLGIGDHADDERDDANETDDTNGTDDAGEESAPTAAVRVAHFSPDAPNVDVYVDDEQVLADVAYDTISPYLEIAPGSYQVKITAAGDPETVVFDEEVPVSRAFYTIAAVGELGAGTFRAMVLTDAGSALIRLVHASPDAPAVDVVGSDSPLALFENVAFGEMTNYVALPAATYSLDVRPAAGDGESAGMTTETDDANETGWNETDSNETVGNETDTNETDGADDAGADDAVASVEVTLETGTAYTAFATGYLGAEPPFAVRLAVDGPNGEPAGEMPADDGEESVEDDPNDTDEEMGENETDDGLNDPDDNETDLDDTDDDLNDTDDDDGFGDDDNETNGFGDDNESDDGLNDTDDDNETDGFGDDNDSEYGNETDDDCGC
ncbi:DUF4397 domain-containing protein [Saliphagus infecundisoli]|uniref:DUF4397 domain-containing protein n=1 Tax=Saliphagus infecundisoli TaxID=1849069 RepID=A0ABD5QD30_9EURY